jgi:hypothetical protein
MIYEEFSIGPVDCKIEVDLQQANCFFTLNYEKQAGELTGIPVQLSGPWYDAQELLFSNREHLAHLIVDKDDPNWPHRLQKIISDIVQARDLAVIKVRQLIDDLRRRNPDESGLRRERLRQLRRQFETLQTPESAYEYYMAAIRDFDGWKPRGLYKRPEGLEAEVYKIYLLLREYIVEIGDRVAGEGRGRGFGRVITHERRVWHAELFWENFGVTVRFGIDNPAEDTGLQVWYYNNPHPATEVAEELEQALYPWPVRLECVGEIVGR